ncbi:MAG: hypothetical protein HQ495_09195 [Alphaproteobacteria bacterium]|nr:hypothetical protein [Alphaproteobacteria bacterium]
MVKIIVAGDGHGAAAVYSGMREGGYLPDLCTDDTDLEKSIHPTGEVVRDISTWVAAASPEDLVISAGYRPRIAVETLLRCRFINIHYALLPRYRGMHATVWAILNGEDEVGYTIHEMDEYLDSGPVLFQETLAVLDRTSWELMLLMDEMVRAAIPSVVSSYIDGQIIARGQIHDDALFVARRNLEDCRVDWERWDAIFFERALKALVPPYPRPFFEYRGRRYEISNAQIVHRYYREIPGHIVYRDDESVFVKLSDGLIRLRSLNSDGNEIPALDVFQRIGIRL